MHRQGEAHLVAKPEHPENRPNTSNGKGEGGVDKGTAEADAEAEAEAEVDADAEERGSKHGYEAAYPPHKRKRDARGAGLGYCGYYR